MAARSRQFESSSHRRFWWHREPGNQYVPPVYALLTDDEWGVIEDWYRETEQHNMVGECTVPLPSVVQGFVGGSGVSRIVQCGHYVGYSTLLLGFLLRHMGRTRGLYSIDNDPLADSVARKWVERAGLTEQVHLELGDSSDPEMPARAKAYLGGDPQIVLIDSSHQYDHTVRELDLWYEAVAPHGLIFLHDTSRFADQFDKKDKGGVRKALADWSVGKTAAVLNINEPVAGGPDYVRPVYADGCGLGLVQKRAA